MILDSAALDAPKVVLDLAAQHVPTALLELAALDAPAVIFDSAALDALRVTLDPAVLDAPTIALVSGRSASTRPKLLSVTLRTLTRRSTLHMLIPGARSRSSMTRRR